jgi:hypothetical protein
MTTARELVNAATAAGAKLAVSGDTLSVTAPRPLAPELVEQLRAAKAEILKMLAAEPDEDYPSPCRSSLVAPPLRNPHHPLGAHRQVDEGRGGAVCLGRIAVPMAPAPRRTGSSLDLCGLRQADCGYRSAGSRRRHEGSFRDGRLLDPLWRVLAECNYAGSLGNGADATMRARARPMKLANDFGP